MKIEEAHRILSSVLTDIDYKYSCLTMSDEELLDWAMEIKGFLAIKNEYGDEELGEFDDDCYKVAQCLGNCYPESRIQVGMKESSEYLIFTAKVKK